MDDALKEEGRRSDEKAGLSNEKVKEKEGLAEGEEEYLSEKGQLNGLKHPNGNTKVEYGLGYGSPSEEKHRIAALQAVTDAIDHAYMATPQLNDQRAEVLLGSGPGSNSSVAMGRSKCAAGTSGAGGGEGGYDELMEDEKDLTTGGKKKGKEKDRAGKRLSAKDEKELNKIWDQIERAHGHSKYLIWCGHLRRDVELIVVG